MAYTTTHFGGASDYQICLPNSAKNNHSAHTDLFNYFEVFNTQVGIIPISFPELEKLNYFAYLTNYRRTTTYRNYFVINSHLTQKLNMPELLGSKSTKLFDPNSSNFLTFFSGFYCPTKRKYTLFQDSSLSGTRFEISFVLV